MNFSITNRKGRTPVVVHSPFGLVENLLVIAGVRPSRILYPVETFEKRFHFVSNYLHAGNGISVFDHFVVGLIYSPPTA